MMRHVRTTVTLDPDLAARLRDLARQRRVTFKSAINSALRAGLDAETDRGRAYREKPRDLGVLSGIDLTKALQLAATLEDDESIRDLELRK